MHSYLIHVSAFLIGLTLSKLFFSIYVQWFIYMQTCSISRAPPPPHTHFLWIENKEINSEPPPPLLVLLNAKIIRTVQSLLNLIFWTKMKIKYALIFFEKAPKNITTCQTPEKNELLRIRVNKRSRSSVCSETEVGLKSYRSSSEIFCCFVLYWSKRHTMALKRLSKVDVVFSIMKCNSKVYYDMKSIFVMYAHWIIYFKIVW